MAWDRPNKYMSRPGTGPINQCHGLGQAQSIYVMAWGRHNQYVMAWDRPNKSMSWLGTGRINICHGLGQAQ